MTDLTRTQVTSANWREIFKQLLVVYGTAIVSYDNAKHRDILVPGRLERESAQVRQCASQLISLVEQVLVMEKASALRQYDIEMKKLEDQSKKPEGNPHNHL